MLKEERYKKIITDSLGFLVKDQRINVYAFVIMPNHFHLIWQMLGDYREHYTFEKHGGANIKDGFFWFLCFYFPEKPVGQFGASRNFLKPYLEDRIELKGEITLQKDNHLEFYIFNKDTGVHIRYTGQIEGDQLHLKYYHEDNSGEVFEGEFEYIGTGESQGVELGFFVLPQFQFLNHLFKFIGFKVCFFAFVIKSKEINRFGLNIQISDYPCTARFALAADGQSYLITIIANGSARSQQTR